MYNKIDVTSPVRKFQNPIRNCFNSSASAEAANAFSVWKRKKDDVERLNALTRDADEENVFWIDDENDDFFVFSALLSISNPDFQSDLGEETTQTLPSKFLRLHFELLFEVLLVEEEAAMRKLEEEFKANMMMIENFTHEMFFCCFFAKKKNIQHHKKFPRKRDLRFILSLSCVAFFQQTGLYITQLKIDVCNSKCILFLTSLQIRNANSSENVGYIYFLSL